MEKETVMSIGPGDTQEAVDARAAQHIIDTAARDAAEAARIAARQAPPIPSGNSIPALRDEVAALRQALINAGLIDP